MIHSKDISYKQAGRKIYSFVNYKTRLLLRLKYSELRSRKHEPGKQMTYTWQTNIEKPLTEHLINVVVTADPPP